MPPDGARRTRRRGQRPATSALVVALALVLALAAPAAGAQPPAPARSAQASASAAGAASAPAPDPLALRSPLCAPALRGALAAAQQRACERTGSPITAAPTAHYGFDINWNPGVTNVGETTIRSVYGLLNLLWLALLFAVRGVLTVLDRALTLNPFALDAGGGLAPALERFFGVVDAVYFSALIAALGLWGIWSGLVRRRATETLGGLAAASAMLALALAVIHAPDRTVGLVARLANQAAMGLMVAPSRGATATPTATYGQVVDRLFDDIVRAPWCALQFRTQRFCTDAAEREAVQQTLAAAREQQLAPALPTAGRVPRGELWLAFAPGSKARTALYEFYGGRDRGKVGAFGITVINTAFGDREGRNPDEVALQGATGGLVRLPLLLVIAGGILGALRVLVWITLRLLDQAMTGMVLLLLAPLALLLVAFGEPGRAAFARWGLALLGALVSKVVYAALLGVVVLASRLLAASADAGDWLLAWLLQSAFWWSVFAKREQLVGYLSVVPSFDGARPGRRLGALVAGSLLAARGRGPARGGALASVRGQALRARVGRSQAVRAASREHLTARADRRADQHRADAEAVLTRDASLRDALDALTLASRAAVAAAGPAAGAGPAVASSALGTLSGGAFVPPLAPPSNAPTEEDGRWDRRPAGLPPASADAHSPSSRERPAPEPARVPAPARAAALGAERAALAPQVAQARAELARRDRGDERDRRRERLEQLQRELDLPAHDARHAWRVGLSPDALLRQRERDPAAHAAHVRAIGDQLTADRAVLRALPSDPRTPPQPTVERAAAGALDERRLRTLRREQRARLRHERAVKRYLHR